MCGRFTLTADPRAVAEYFTLPDFPAVSPRYNIAPGQKAPVVVQAESARQLRPMKWGLIPSWARDESIGYMTINAKAETVADPRPTVRPPATEVSRRRGPGLPSPAQWVPTRRSPGGG
jgi:putative SOS response-associated peptidase YedK